MPRVVFWDFQAFFHWQAFCLTRWPQARPLAGRLARPDSPHNEDPAMSETVKATFDGKEIEFPVIVGTENEKAIDISKLRSSTGYITFDDGYKNTGACRSKITFIDGEKGILQYRGYPIEEMAEKSTFLETAYLIIFGELPTKAELSHFQELVAKHTPIHYDMRHAFESFPANANPMAILSAMFNMVSCYSPHLLDGDYTPEQLVEASARLLGKTSTIAAYTFKKANGRPFSFSNPKLDYSANFLHMMFTEPYQEYMCDPDVVRAMDLILVLHADHEQNCSTSTVRMVGSSRANLFASVASGVAALWGPLHGGANQAVIKQLLEIHESGQSIDQVMERAKDKNSGFRLMGFGHRVYKNFDPRAKILKKACDKVLASLKTRDPLLDIARALEERALEDEYFIERKLYPNVDFYSGIVMRAIGIPLDMFTVMFAMGRMPGWIANWYELRTDPNSVINRPRQVYEGATKRSYVPVDKR
ncbi:MAG: citrate synthase [Candidatus Sumerlaeota bacterium]|nr:citrate synthase [Candidatus Sumerlaeota bacterium]